MTRCQLDTASEAVVSHRGDFIGSDPSCLPWPAYFFLIPALNLITSAGEDHAPSPVFRPLLPVICDRRAVAVRPQLGPTSNRHIERNRHRSQGCRGSCSARYVDLDRNRPKARGEYFIGRCL